MWLYLVASYGNTDLTATKAGANKTLQQNFYFRYWIKTIVIALLKTLITSKSRVGLYYLFLLVFDFDEFFQLDKRTTIDRSSGCLTAKWTWNSQADNR